MFSSSDTVSCFYDSRLGVNLTRTPHNVMLQLHCLSCLNEKYDRVTLSVSAVRESHVAGYRHVARCQRGVGLPVGG